MKVPTDNLVRAWARPEACQLRSADGGGDGRTIFGHFAVFDRWTEINSWIEGRFLERIAPGAFVDSFAGRGLGIRILLEHGHDPQVGNKPIAQPTVFREDEIGAYYEGRLLDAAYVRDLMPALEAGQFGASFRFRVLDETWDDNPGRSESNPEGLPERTIKRVDVMEVGPVTFAAYDAATAGLRSSTDEFHEWLNDPIFVARFTERVGSKIVEQVLATLPADGRGDPTSSAADGVVDASRPDREHATHRRQWLAGLATPPTPTSEGDHAVSARAQIEARLAELTPSISHLAELDELTDEQRSQWDAETAEFDELKARLDDLDARAARAKALRESPFNPHVGAVTSDPFDIDARDLSRLTVPEVRDRAMRAVERSTGWAADGHRESLVSLIERGGSLGAEASRLTLVAGSEAYRSAWAKAMSGAPLGAEDSNLLSRAMTSGTGASGGYIVPVQIDPTLIITGAGSANPFRRIARVRQTTVPVYNGATVGQITAAYTAENATVPDNTPTLAQVQVPTHKVTAYVPASFEAFEDIDNLATDVAELFSDARDNFEAAQFATGTGLGAITGVVTAVTAVTASRVSPATGGAYGVADVYSVHTALPPRHRVAASAASRAWVSNVAVIDATRQFATANNYHAFLTDLGGGQPPQLLGDQWVESSAMSSTFTTGQNVLLYGDFSRYYIVDRLGATTEFIPNVFDPDTGRPTGTRAWLMHWRVGGAVADANAFRILKL